MSTAAPATTGVAMTGLIGAELRLPDGRRVLVRSEIGDGLLEIIELPTGRLFRVEDPLTGEMHLPDGRFLEDLSAAGDLRIVRRPGATAPVKARRMRTYTADEARRLDPLAEMKVWTIRSLRDRGVSGDHPDLARHLEEVWATAAGRGFGDMPRVRRVRDWFKRVDPESVGVLDVMSMSGRVARRSPIDPALNRIYAKHAHEYWHEERKGRGWSVLDATAAAAAERKETNARRLLRGEAPLPEINRETMRRRINALLCRDAYAAKWGENAAKRKFDGGGDGLTAARILEAVLMDNTVVDCVMVYDRGVIGRAYLTASLDVHSRANPGIVVGMTPPSHHTAALCLRRTNRSKTIPAHRLAKDPALAQIGGKPVRIIVDNGRDFCSPAFIETCADLGITVEVAPVGMPRAKPMIERFFHTLNQYLIHKLKGATLDPSTLRKLGIDPATEAVVTLETLQHLMDEFVLYYHTRFHSGAGARPVDKWKRSMNQGHRHVLDDEDPLDVLFGVVVHGRRITANGGIRMFGRLVYKSADMRQRIIDPLCGREPHRKRLDATTACTVKVRYDPADLGRIWVEVGADWIPLDCTDGGYARGLSKWQHERIREFARRERLRFESAARTASGTTLSRSADVIAAAPRRVLEAPPVAPGESLIGLVRSCAWRNGLPSVGALLREASDAMQVWSNLSLRDDVDTDRLAVSMRLPAAEIARRMHPERRAAPELVLRSFFDAEVRSHDLAVGRRSFAPAALASRPHHRATWQIGLLPFCTETGEMLVERCAGCGNRLGWSAAKRLTHCSTCRRPVSTGSVENVGVEVLDGTSPLTDLLRPREDDATFGRVALHEDLRDVPAGAVFDLAWSVARTLVDHPVGLRRLDVDLPARTRVAILRIAGEIVTGWPESLDGALRRLIAKDATRGRRALSRLRQLVAPCRRWPEQHELLLRSHPHLLAHTRNAAHIVHGDAMDGGAAARMLAIDADLLPRLVEAGELETVAARRGIHLSAGYDGASLRRLRSLRDDCISMESVSERLGITLHGVEQLVCLGQLREHGGPAVAIMRTRRQVSRGDFDRLVGRVTLKTVADVEDGVPLRSAARVIGGREKPWGEMLRLIADGRIRALWSPPATSEAREGRRPRPLVDDLLVSRMDLPILALATFDAAAHPGFRFATDVSRRDMEDTLNISPGPSGLVLDGELSHAVLSSGRLDRRAVLALARSRISPGEIAAKHMDFSRRLPKTMRTGGPKRLGASGWDRTCVERLLAPPGSTKAQSASPAPIVDRGTMVRKPLLPCFRHSEGARQDDRRTLTRAQVKQGKPE